MRLVSSSTPFLANALYAAAAPMSAPPDISTFRQRLSFWSICPHTSGILIEAKKSPALERIYAAYARRLIRRAFGKLRITGAEFPRAELPVIVYMNHSAWWDAVIPVHLSHDLFRREIHALMEGEQIGKYPFFRHLGCFGPTSSGLSEARAVVSYATRALRSGNRPVLWICPQGALLPARIPMTFKSGLAHIAAAVPEAIIVPMAFRYEFLKNRKPDCWVRTGEPVVRREEASSHFTRRLELHLEQELALLDAEILSER